MNHATAQLRPGRQDDALLLARLMNVASGGTGEYALSGLERGVSADEMLARAVAREDSEFSFRRCTVAEVNGRLAGATNCFTPQEKVELAANSERVMGRWTRFRFHRRLRKLSAFAELQYPDSLCIDTIAVLPELRSRGLGALLMESVKAAARGRGLSQVSLQVWVDNTAGRRFYARHGFVERQRIDFTPPRGLAHMGGLALLVCNV